MDLILDRACEAFAKGFKLAGARGSAQATAERPDRPSVSVHVCRVNEDVGALITGLSNEQAHGIYGRRASLRAQVARTLLDFGLPFEDGVCGVIQKTAGRGLLRPPWRPTAVAPRRCGCASDHLNLGFSCQFHTLNMVFSAVRFHVSPYPCRFSV